MLRLVIRRSYLSLLLLSGTFSEAALGQDGLLGASTPVNYRPVADVQDVTTEASTFVEIALSGYDANGDSLVYTVVLPPMNGSLSNFDEVSGLVTYTPNGGFTGSDDFSFVVNDGLENSEEAFISITVDPIPNTSPNVVAGNNQTVPEGTAVNLDPATFSDPDGGDSHTATINWGDGTIVPSFPVSGGTVSGSHAYADDGIYTVTIIVTDSPAGMAGSDTLTATVNNEDPVVSAGGAQTITEGDTFSGSGSFTDAGSADTHTATVNYGDGSNTQPLTLSGNSFDLSHTYNTVGSYTMIVTVSDDDGGSDAGTLTVMVDPALPVPVANDDLALLVKGRAVSIDVLGNDTGSGLFVQSADQASNGTVTVNADNTVTYKRDKNFKDGCDQFNYMIEDSIGATATALVQVSVGSADACGAPGNSPPVAQDDSVTTFEDVPVSVTLTATDVDNDPLTFAIDSSPSNGTLSGTVPNLTYTPDTGFVGSNSLTFHANDGLVNSNFATVLIDILEASMGLHMGDLDGLSVNIGRGQWMASAILTLHNSSHNPVSGATISYSWSGGFSGTDTCVTNGSGQCPSVTTGGIKKKNGTATLTVTNVVHGSLNYTSAANHDPDNDSNGTSITINKP